MVFIALIRKGIHMINEPPVGAVVRVKYEDGRFGGMYRGQGYVWEHIDASGWELVGDDMGTVEWADVIDGAVKIERAVFVRVWPRGSR